MPDQDSKARFFCCLDGIRGIAALLVVLRHTPLFFGGFAFQESYLAVDVFFLLSGVVICNAYERKLLAGLTVSRFVWIRMVRIYPLYLLGLLIALAAVVVGREKSMSYDIYHAVTSLLLLPNPEVELQGYFPLDAPAWSLFFEMVINVVYAYLVSVLSTRRILAVTFISFLGLVCFVYLSPSRSADIGWTLKSFPAGLFRVSFSFFMGVLLCRAYKARPVVVKGLLGTLLPWIVLSGIAFILTRAPENNIRPIFDLAVVALVFPYIVALALVAEPSYRAGQFFRFVGAISYAVYVLHAPLGAFALEILGQDVVMKAAPGVGLAFMVALVALCWSLDRFYDAPLRRLLLGLRFVRRSESMRAPALT
jgi:peptidoglycan/LPS O-acetylase OafA/YrhL